ncbi:serine/threonine-protein kinase, partial [uncultured Rubinisphaera sp.]|uniref:serine/threonine protein kinase n=1 Tax=uncultured Rubinisphaera sp. TaxID=1678686 RepID=UPI0030DDB805
MTPDLHDLADQFDAARRRGEAPRIDTYLKQVAESERNELLATLLEVEFEYLLSEEKPVAVTDYKQEFPGHDAIINRAYEEARRRQQLAGAAPESKHAIIEEVGPYKILQIIGQGGMGTVYMAEQKRPIRRRVALKVIKPGLDTKEVLARFEAERQALAIMDHPNIAKVLDAGLTENGLPYFAMELVKGIPITQFCDKNNLSLNNRLKLFISVCHAIQHAHQKGIIHRDIKPSNVLVAMYDDKPVVKVIDFGLAKATQHILTERTLFTQFGQIVGTPEYMSPEQSMVNQLDIDTRTDVYSLGVLLYELLTGSTPLESERVR